MYFQIPPLCQELCTGNVTNINFQVPAFSLLIPVLILILILIPHLVTYIVYSVMFYKQVCYCELNF